MGKNEHKRPDYVVLEEEIEDNYQPTQEELTEYAEWLGMVLPRDKDLLWIAHEGLTKPLAKEWKPCRTEDDEIYYFNFETGDSRWDHPCDEVHRNLLRAELHRLGRPLANQQIYATEPSSSSQSKPQDSTDDHRHKGAHEEKAGSEVIASIAEPSEVHPSEKGIKSQNNVSTSRLSSPSYVDSRTHEQMHDANGSQTVRVSEKLSKQEEVKATSTAWKYKKGIDEVVGFTSGSKDEEDREMTVQREQMMELVKKKMEEEKSVVLQQARRAMQERVAIVINEEEAGLLADKRAKMLDVVDKQMELEKETEVARRRGKLKIELDEEMEGERNEMVEEERTKMFDEVAKQIHEERSAEVMRRRKVQSDQKSQTEATKEDLKGEETRQVRKCSKRKEEHQNDCGGEGLLRLNLELDEKLGSLFPDSAGGKLQDSRDHMLHCDLCSSTVLERREFACTLKEKLKLEELELYDELRKEMVIRVREVISALERRMFEEEHRLATTKLHNRVNRLFEGFTQEAEIQLLQEKEWLLREKREDMHRRLCPSGALEIPVAASFDSGTAVKGWRGADDENSGVEIEYLWSNREHCRRIQVDKLEKAEDILSRRYSGRSSGDVESSFSSNTSFLPPRRRRPQSKEETNMRVEDIWSRSKSTPSTFSADRLETMNASVDITPNLKILRSQLEESLRDLMEQFRQELRKELLSLTGNRDFAYLASADQQESSGVLDLPKDLPSSLGGWRSEVGKGLRDQFQKCRDDLENKFRTLKGEVKEVLKVLLTLKDVIPETLRRTEQECRSKLVINENENRCQHLVAPHGKANRVDAGDMPDFAQVGHFSVHVMLEAKKSKLSKLDQWISEAQAPMVSKFIPEHPRVKRYQTCGKEKTAENAERFSFAKSEEKLLPNSLRYANEYDWTRTQRNSRLDHLAQKERSRLQAERVNKALQKYMKWIMQQISSGWKRADTICLMCGLAMRRTVRRLDSGWTIVVSLIQKSRRECKSARYKRTHEFHTSFDSENSSRQTRWLDRSPRIDPRLRHKDVDGRVAPQKLRRTGLRAPRGLSPPQNLGNEKSLSDFHLALCPQENEGKMRWLYSNSELEELRDLWNMDAGYANPTTKQHQEVPKQHQAQVQASGVWTERAGDSSISELTEDTGSSFTIKDTVSRRGTSSTSLERLSQLDMLELQDAVAMFRQSRESPNMDGSSLEQGDRTDSEKQRTNEVLKARAIQDEEETELLQLRAQPWTLSMASEIEEVEDRAPGFITLEFAMPREDGFAFPGMQVKRYQCNSNCQHSQPNPHSGAPQTIWRI